jgi:hypothetical protein
LSKLGERIAKLEGQAKQRETFYVWRESGETAERAEARFRSEHPEAAAKAVVVIGWMEETA